MVTEHKENKKIIFAKGICFNKLFWIFLVGCVVGVLIETLYCLILGGHFEVRWGVIYGPFNPVYGFGTVIITLALNKFSNSSKLKIFVLSVFLGGAYEYFCSFFQEITLGAVSWNYKEANFNFSGRTTLTYAFCWGLLGLVWIKKIYPRISDWIESFPHRLGKVSTFFLLWFMVFNMLVSSAAVWRYSNRSNGILPKNRLEFILDDLYPNEVIKRVYPNMKVIKK